MANPQIIDQKPVFLVEVKDTLLQLEKRDKELNFLSNRTKEYVETFVTFTVEQKEKLYKKILDLGVVRLKEEHIIKIIDYLPKDVEDLKVVLQAYPLSLSKKDQEAIIKEISEI